jgi:hypothetical protein
MRDTQVEHSISYNKMRLLKMRILNAGPEVCTLEIHIVCAGGSGTKEPKFYVTASGFLTEYMDGGGYLYSVGWTSAWRNVRTEEKSLAECYSFRIGSGLI